MTKLDEQTMVEAWRGLLFAHARVIQGLESDMLEQHAISLTWFDVLGRLRSASNGRLRMNELEDASVFTRSGMTRLVDRIETAGLVRRTRSPEDRRGVYVEITSSGHDKFDAVWPDHIKSIERHFGRYVEPKEAAALRSATTKIREGEPG